ncbi:MAG: hypothetical protein K6B72_01035 [Lachnospiraceae bacterium]|nr:hypothetical protein [Lachnospiraceae bacterium]
MQIKVTTDHRYEPHCYREKDTIIFCGYFPKTAKCGIIFYKKDGSDPITVNLPENCRIGRMYAVRIQGIDRAYDRYRLLSGGKDFADPCAFLVYGLEDFAKPSPEDRIYGRVFDISPADLIERNEKSALRLRRNDEDEQLYLLHVRGFTMSPSAGVERSHRGTFAGVIDKADHIASLGTTTVELMPSYELISREPAGPENASAAKTEKELPTRCNYWGFKEGFYFAPRSAYASGDPCEEFHEMVSCLHKRKISVIMQFWFPERYPAALILAVCRHWLLFYGVDGFHLIGGRLPAESLAADPVLADAKIYYDTLDTARIAASGGSQNLSLYRDDFQIAVRRFLKSDNLSISPFFGEMTRVNEGCGHVNYLADYRGFRLADSVAYEHRHNEANHENNADGTDNNLTWNCGVEGRSRRKTILRLRRRQIFNQLVMLFFAQGTPMLFAGDEFLHSQDGNNNPYCQDNAISWVNWKMEQNALGQDTLSFVRFLSAYRREHKILRQSRPFRLMDYKAFGFPDLSLHGMEAWQPDFSDYSHSVAMLYCNLYAKEQDPAFLYCIYNCSWESRRFALPTIQKSLHWTVVIDTSKEGAEIRDHDLSGEKTILLAPRSCVIMEVRGKYRIASSEQRTPF